MGFLYYKIITMNFRTIFEMLNAKEHFNQGMEVEILKGYFKKRTLLERMYWTIRMASYKNTK